MCFGVWESLLITFVALRDTYNYSRFHRPAIGAALAHGQTRCPGNNTAEPRPHMHPRVVIVIQHTQWPPSKAPLFYIKIVIGAPLLPSCRKPTHRLVQFLATGPLDGTKYVPPSPHPPAQLQGPGHMCFVGGWKPIIARTFHVMMLRVPEHTVLVGERKPIIT